MCVMENRMKTQMQFQFWGLATAFCLATLVTMTEAAHGRYGCEALVAVFGCMFCS